MQCPACPHVAVSQLSFHRHLVLHHHVALEIHNGHEEFRHMPPQEAEQRVRAIRIGGVADSAASKWKRLLVTRRRRGIQHRICQPYIIPTSLRLHPTRSSLTALYQRAWSTCWSCRSLDVCRRERLPHCHQLLLKLPVWCRFRRWLHVRHPRDRALGRRFRHARPSSLAPPTPPCRLRLPHRRRRSMRYVTLGP